MASFPEPNLIMSFAAGSDLSTKQYKAVTVSSGTIAVASTGGNAIGFLMNAPTSGQACEIATLGGGAKAIAGGTIAAGDLLEVDSNGDLVYATGAAENVVARALQSAVDNDVFAVQVLFDRVGTTV
jgi:hypothetical protein